MQAGKFPVSSALWSHNTTTGAGAVERNPIYAFSLWTLFFILVCTFRLQGKVIQ